MEPDAAGVPAAEELHYVAYVAAAASVWRWRYGSEKKRYRARGAWVEPHKRIAAD